MCLDAAVGQEDYTPEPPCKACEQLNSAILWTDTDEDFERAMELYELHQICKHVDDFMFPAYYLGFNSDEEMEARRQELTRKLGM